MKSKRLRRPSRFRWKPKTPTPRFDVGDQAGEFNVLEYLGHSANKPFKPERLKVEHHWYRVRCSCGTEEIHTQQQLIDVRRNRMCVTCTDKLKEMLRNENNH